MSELRILIVGDIVGRPGRVAAQRLLPELRSELRLDLIIVNCENAAAGAGITAGTAEELFQAGADALTSGNHVWKMKGVAELLRLDHRVLRPANYPDRAPGFGSVVVETLSGVKVGVLNLQGRVFMEPIDCPFRTADREVERLRMTTPIIIVDMHAEATSEKVALGWYLDGRVSAIVGTHTHIATADERILPKGTAYLTDLGMSGPYESVIGRRVDQIMERFLTGVMTRSDVADGDIQLHGALVRVDATTGKALGIERVARTLEERVSGVERR
jgi:metallophosphoesterase (TIGR00282 family)